MIFAVIGQVTQNNCHYKEGPEEEGGGGRGYKSHFPSYFLSKSQSHSQSFVCDSQNPNPTDPNSIIPVWKKRQIPILSLQAPLQTSSDEKLNYFRR